MMDYAQLICPFCSEVNQVAIPKDRCLVMHKCQYCQKIITPKQGSCCVICDYSDKTCPVSNRTTQI